MGLKKIVEYPDPILNQNCDKITDFGKETKALVQDLIDTLYAEKNGIGLAAPQIGILKRIFIIDLTEDRTNLMVFINPEIELSKEKIISEEGCLSIPGYREKIKRAQSVKVKAYDQNGKEFTLEANELLGRCIQHENDHINGILYIDHFSALKKSYFKKWLRKQK